MSYTFQDLGSKTLKELIRLNPDYIRIYPTQNKLYAIARNIPFLLAGKASRMDASFTVEIPINFCIKDTVNGTSNPPNEIHLHNSDCDTFLTLLKLHPSAITIEYYHNGMSEGWSKTHGLKLEGLYITGTQQTKNRKVTSSKIAIEHTYDNTINRLARW